jgi:hypothetical protein
MKKIILFGITGICIGIISGLSSSPIASVLITSIFGLFAGVVEIYKIIIKNKKDSSFENHFDSSPFIITIGITLGIFIGIELKYFEFRIHKDDIKEIALLTIDTTCSKKLSNIDLEMPLEKGKINTEILKACDTSSISEISNVMLQSGNPILMRSANDTLAIKSFLIGYKLK